MCISFYLDCITIAMLVMMFLLHTVRWPHHVHYAVTCQWISVVGQIFSLLTVFCLLQAPPLTEAPPPKFDQFSIQIQHWKAQNLSLYSTESPPVPLLGRLRYACYLIHDQMTKLQLEHGKGEK